MRQLISNQQDIVRRDKELREILKSIVELQELFKEFSSMVIEQGTILDRIDYNIETASTLVKQGNENLITAEKYQKWGGITICLLVAFIALAVVIALVVLRLVFKFGLGI